MIIILLITTTVIWRGFFKKEKEISLEEVFVLPKKEIKFDFRILENLSLKILQPFTEIEPFKETVSEEGEIEEKLGRENPFVPY